MSNFQTDKHEALFTGLKNIHHDKYVDLTFMHSVRNNGSISISVHEDVILSNIKNRDVGSLIEDIVGEVSRQKMAHAKRSNHAKFADALEKLDAAIGRSARMHGPGPEVVALWDARNAINQIRIAD